MSTTSRLLIAAALLLAPACKDSSKAEDQAPRPAPTKTMPPTEGSASGSAQGSAAGSATVNVASLNDAQILAIGAMAHQTEIDAGKLAATKATNADVKAFAQMMVDEHGKALADGKALAEKLAITPVDSELVTTIRTQADATKTKLDGLTGDNFDLAYMDAMVTGHQGVLDLLDQRLIPSATNADLKAALEALRPKVAEHLEHAKKVQAGVKRPS